MVFNKGRFQIVLAGLAVCALAPAAADAPQALPQEVVINDADVYPESMSAARDGTLYIGSMKGVVFRALPGASKAEAWIAPTAENGLLSIFGVLTDERSGTLWVCSSPTSLRQPPAIGVAALMAFDLKTGQQKGAFRFPPPASICNDITIAQDGTAFASDTPNGRILRLAPGSKTLEVLVQDDRLKGIDGIVFSADGTLYANIVTRGQLVRVERKPGGAVADIVTLETSLPLAAPDGFRLLEGNKFLLAEGSAGRIDEVAIEGDRALIRVLRDGLISPPAVTFVGHVAYALEGKIGYLVDPRLKGQDPGLFKAYAVPLQEADKGLETQLATLSEEVQRLEDANAIRKLQRAYGYYIDKGYWDQAADLLTDEATLETGVDGVYVGKAHIRDLLIRQGGGHPGPGLPYGQMNHHMQLQPLVHVAADGRSAQARWRELALLGQFHEYAAWGDGIAENEYVKEGGVWKIQKIHFYPNFLAPYQGGWAALKPVDADWRSSVAKAFPADRPPTLRYRPYPEFFVPPFHYRTPVTDVIPVASKPKAALAADQREIDLLRSHEALEALQAGYGYYFDKGLWPQVAALFSQDATFEFGQRGVYVGRTHILKALSALFGSGGLKPGQLNNYMMLQPIIDVASDNRTAKARWRSDVELAADGKGQWSEGEYENEYVNEGGHWRISKLHYYVTVIADYDKGWHDGPIAMDGPSKVLPPDRPPTELYASFPDVYLPAYHYRNPVTGETPAPHVRGESAPVRALEDRIVRLQDLNAIEKVQRAYGYYVDKAQWPDVADLYQENGTLEIGGRGVFVGKKRALEYLITGLGPVGPRKGQIINHQQFQGIVDVGPDGRIGHGRWTAFVMGTGGWGDCTYENEYVKEGGIWKIAKLHASFNMYTSYKEGWQFAATPNTRPDSFLPPPDLAPTTIYLTYPSFFVEPFHYPNPVTGRAMPRPNAAAGGVAAMEAYKSP
jgi:sugar lactone lactonase YvrE